MRTRVGHALVDHADIHEYALISVHSLLVQVIPCLVMVAAATQAQTVISSS